MSEQRREVAELDAVPVIAAALHDWLQAEVESSMAGRNAVLDDWQKFQTDIHLPFDDDRNQDARKASGHYDRLQGATTSTEYISGLESDDDFLSWQTFFAQMFVSGAFRRQCLVQAISQSDYEQRRSAGPLGIDLTTTVAARLCEVEAANGSQDFLYHGAPWGKLQSRTMFTNQEALDMAELVQELARRDSGQEESPTVQLLRNLQKMWVSLAVDYIDFAAQRPGHSLADVPFREPKSISDDPQIYYPFRAVA